MSEKHLYEQRKREERKLDQALRKRRQKRMMVRIVHSRNDEELNK